MINLQICNNKMEDHRECPICIKNLLIQDLHFKIEDTKSKRDMNIGVFVFQLILTINYIYMSTHYNWNIIGTLIIIAFLGSLLGWSLSCIVVQINKNIAFKELLKRATAS